MMEAERKSAPCVPIEGEIALRPQDVMLFLWGECDDLKIEELQRKIATIEAGDVDVDAIIQQVLAKIPQQEAAPIDLVPITQEVKEYTDAQISSLNERYANDGASLNERFNALQVEIDALKAEITALKELPALKVVEEVVEEAPPVEEQPPQ